MLTTDRLIILTAVRDQPVELELARLVDGSLQLRWDAGRGAELQEAALLSEESWLPIPESRDRDEWTPATNVDSSLFRLVLP